MQHWKKIGLSVAVVLTFAAYSFQQRHEAGKALAVATVPVTQPQTPTQQPAGPSSSSSSSGKPKPTTSGQYKNGTFTGDPADAYYGYIQVQVVISGGKIADVIFLDHPNDNGQSQYINQQAMPLLKQEAISAQSAQVNGVSGATDTSMAFVQSLQSALSKAV